MNGVTGLQDGPHTRARTAAHKAEMAAMFARQQFGDSTGLTVPPHAKHDALVGPFHDARYYRIPSSCAGGIATHTFDLSNQPRASPVNE
jgi:hypothetical protein